MDFYLGEIRLFACNYAPSQWALCSGQLLGISQYTALYSLLGTYYGGNGTTNFGLPNLNGRIPVGTGQGAGTSNYTLGQVFGVSSVTLTQPQMAAHTHTLPCGGNSTPNTAPSPQSYLAAPAGSGHAPGSPYYVTPATQSTSSVTMAANEAGFAGGNQAHNNMSPYLGLNYCIALQGIYPPRP